MILINVCRNIQLAIDSIDGGGGGSVGDSGGGGSAAPATKTSAASSSAKAPTAKVTASSPVTQGVNPFIALAAKAGFAPKHAVQTQPNKEQLNIDFGVSSDGASDAEIPITKITKNNESNKTTVESESIYEEGENFTDSSKNTSDGDNKTEETNASNNENVEQNSEQESKIADGAGDTDKQLDAQKQKKAPFDLNKLEPEDRQFAKRMHSSAAEHFSKKINTLRGEVAARDEQLKTIEKGGMPLSYYNHPDAYQLHPEFTATQSRLGDVSKENNFWRDQLIAIEGNQQFYIFEGTTAEGKDIIKGPFQPSPTAKVSIQNAMYQTAQVAATEKAKLEQLKATFKTDYEKNSKIIEDGIKDKLGFLLKDGVDKESVMMFGKDGKPTPSTIGEVKEAFMRELPPVYKNHPLAKGMTQLFAAFQLLGSAFLKSEAAQAKTTITNRSAAAAEPPTNGDTTPTVSRNGGNRQVIIAGKKRPDVSFKFDPKSL